MLYDDEVEDPQEEEEDEKCLNFHAMELDDRILKAIAKLGWLEPTLIQEKAIPLLLEGKDVLLRARTGSGKTAAFAIPVIQKILNSKLVAEEQTVKALILAPSRELCSQIHKNFSELTIKCSREVQCVDLSSQVDVAAQRPLLVFCPDIVVATPSRALEHLKAKNLNLKKSLEILVIDEADLVFSFGFETEIKEIVQYLPSVCQAALASATLSEDVLDLKRLVLHNPVTLKLNEAQLAPASQLTHYVLAAEEQDKAAILCTLLKLQLVRGKIIIFVNTVDKCYKLKLFLEQFGIRSCILNSELPANVRCHSVNQFNNGMYDVIIASDEQALETTVPQNTKRKSRRRKDKESGVARGIDFQCVSNVLNFDFPLDVNSYVHRAGRTARGNNKGTTLSFVSLREMPLMKIVEESLEPSYEGRFFKTYEFKIEEVEGFRYRSKDAWRAVTRVAVREARLKEIKQEMINSKALKGYFEDNPNDFNTLRHDKALHTVRLQHHLSDVPEYLVPNSLKRISTAPSRKRSAPALPPTQLSYTKRKFQKKQANPLLSFEFMGFKKDEDDEKKKAEKAKMHSELSGHSSWQPAEQPTEKAKKKKKKTKKKKSKHS